MGDATYDQIITALATSPPPMTCRLAFYECRQGARESSADFVAALRELGLLCESENLGVALQDKSIGGLREGKVAATEEGPLVKALSKAAAGERTRGPNCSQPEHLSTPGNLDKALHMHQPPPKEILAVNAAYGTPHSGHLHQLQRTP